MACTDATEPGDLVGTWRAITWEARHNETTHDVLAAGGSMSLTLAADGTVTGHITLPDLGDGVFNQFDLDVTNTTWDLDTSAASVAFEGFPALAEAPFVVANEQLIQDSGSEALGMRVVLEQSGN